MAANIHDHLTDQLFKAILSLKDEEQCYKFFEDICTISELKAMAQRLEVARMLDEGCIYETIVEKTGASTATNRATSRMAADGPTPTVICSGKRLASSQISSARISSASAMPASLRQLGPKVWESVLMAYFTRPMVVSTSLTLVCSRLS